MKDVRCDLAELESDKPVEIFERKFASDYHPNGALFDSSLLKNEIINTSPEEGLWVRKWDVTLFKKGLLRTGTADAPGRKLTLLYFLDPSLLNSIKEQKNFSQSCRGNQLLLFNNVQMDCGHLPKQPFHVIEVTFSISWLTKQIEKEKRSFAYALEQIIKKRNGRAYIEDCQESEYKLLYELDKSLQSSKDNCSIGSSKVYELILSFFQKLFSVGLKFEAKTNAYYEQRLIDAEAEIIENLLSPLKLKAIAKKVSMSQSSLLRQFKSKYGKSLQAYYIEKKMELAKKMIQEKNISVRKISELFNYTHPSHFIKIFAKQFGYNPGIIKNIKSYRI